MKKTGNTNVPQRQRQGRCDRTNGRTGGVVVGSATASDRWAYPGGFVRMARGQFPPRAPQAPVPEVLVI